MQSIELLSVEWIGHIASLLQKLVQIVLDRRYLITLITRVMGNKFPYNRNASL